MIATSDQRFLSANACAQIIVGTGNFLDSAEEVEALTRAVQSKLIEAVPPAGPPGRTVEELRRGLVCTMEVCLEHLKRKLQ